MWQSTKTYGPEVGLSCAFRQWRAESHCLYTHGYALSFKFVFESEALDDNGWVVDFGGLSDLRDNLKRYFDHTTAVAFDDPMMDFFKEARDLSIIDLRVFPRGVGCERFAEFAHGMAAEIIKKKYGDRITVVSCECSEHGANSATYKPSPCHQD